MLFNSIEFIFFLPLVTILYFIISYNYRWILLLIASYYFYMSWNPSYLILIIFTTFVSYIGALKMAKVNAKNKKIYLIACLSINLGILFFFKYFNFFSIFINDFSNELNYQINTPVYNFLLPVGISFYTFQSLSYTIDVYKNKILPEKHLGIFALYVSFFPQLIAGPIERSTRLLPQFHKKNDFSFNNFSCGIKWIIIGFFMKLVVADRLSIYVDSVYNNVLEHSGVTFFLASFLFAFQIYCDFAGYSNIAIGSAKILGYDLMINFKRPYLALSMRDFWNRWHISLSTWFRDYVYINLGGSRVSNLKMFYNLFITFLISGFWHGANWTFLIWGAIHGTYIIFEKLFNLDIEKPSHYSILNKLFRNFIVFNLVVFAWIFFRANNLNDAYYIIINMFDFNNVIFYNSETFFYAFIGLFVLWFNDLLEEFKYKNQYLKKNNSIFISFYYAILTLFIFYFGVFNGGQFIYFQF